MDDSNVQHALEDEVIMPGKSAIARLESGDFIMLNFNKELTVEEIEKQIKELGMELPTEEEVKKVREGVESGKIKIEEEDVFVEEDK
jgi:TusA-related sulfurtransferase